MPRPALIRPLLAGVLATLIGSLTAAESTSSGTVAGVVIDSATKQPIEYVAAKLKPANDPQATRSAATDAKGAFAFEDVPFGNYLVSYSLVGGASDQTAVFRVDAGHRTIDLGALPLVGGGPVKMAQVDVTAHREAFYNSIDRKVYLVGKDLRSATGSASDLLQNVPSVQVDIEGNVALRGDTNVLILINGKTSTMMGKNRAAVLEQMPADGIEKIEVITNPTAKYQPDGTAGIINLTLKKNQDAGRAGTVRVVAGNNRRYSAGFTANYHPGRSNLYGSASVRQDDRPRFVDDERSHLDSATNRPVTTTQRTHEQSRPLSRLVQAGIDHNLDDHTKIGASVNSNYRDFVRHSTVATLSRDSAGAVTNDYDRVRTDPEFEQDLEFTGTFERAFSKEDQALTLEIKHGQTTEQEDNHYANVYRTPAIATTLDATLIKQTETTTEGTADYSHPFDEDSKLEVGYRGQATRVDLDFHGSFFDPVARTWEVDGLKTNRFIYDATIHALYGTYARKIEKFGFLAGLRFEQATIHTDQATARLTDKTDYRNLYPSLHLTYDFTAAHQLQLNYSHRVHRPEADDLNPFPEYQDPFNLRAGNPKLKPEQIHSVETGYQYHHDDTTYFATAYYRYRYQGMTDVSRYLSSTTLLTTKENLSTSRSGGLEFGATTRLRDRLTLNFSGNVYRNEIDAANLGFASNRSTIAWDAKLNANWDLSKTTLVQLNSNYTAKRLTPQGYRYPTYVTNVGLRHNLTDKKIALIVSVSDVFDSLKERTHIDTPVLHQDVVRRRSSRILYAGFVYTFGKSTKKPKDDLQFDNSL